MESKPCRDREAKGRDLPSAQHLWAGWQDSVSCCNLLFPATSLLLWTTVEACHAMGPSSFIRYSLHKMLS